MSFPLKPTQKPLWKRVIIWFFGGWLALSALALFIPKSEEELAADREKERAQLIAQQAEVQRQAEEKVLAEKAARIEEEACRQDLRCWGDKFNLAASFECEDEVERMANYSSRWTDGFLEPKFSHFRWRDKVTGIVTYVGDKIEFQNGFGAWQNFVYECDFDTQHQQALSVRGEPGRL